MSKLFLKIIRSLPSILFSATAIFFFVFFSFYLKITRKKLILFELYTSRIGHIIYNSESAYRLIKERYDFKSVTVFAVSFQRCCNSYIIRKLKGSLNFSCLFFHKSFRRGFDFILKIISSYLEVIYIPFSDIHPRSYSFASKPRLVDIDKNDIKFRNLYQKKFGLVTNNYISVHNRDSFYLNRYKLDENNHDYRDYSIDDLEILADWLTNNNLGFVRHGEVQSPVRSEILKDKIIDLSNINKPPSLDSLLVSDCLFYLGCGSGFSTVAMMYRKPMLLINYMPYRFDELCIYTPGSIVLPKLLRKKECGTFLSFKEISMFPYNLHNKQCPFESLGIEVINNSPIDILEGAKQMLSMCNGTYKQSEISIELQNKFWNSIKNIEGSFQTRNANITIPDSFLIKNQNLIR